MTHITLPVLLALISGGILALIGIVFLGVFVWDYFHRYGTKRVLLLILYLTILIAIITLYVCLWFILPYLVMIGITFVVAILIGGIVVLVE